MREINKIAEALFEKIRDRFEDVSLGDDNAKATQNPEDARFFNFDYVVDGHSHGNITMSIIDENSLKVYFSKNISKDLDPEHKKEWFAFLRELREFARRNLMSFEPRDITRSTLKHRDIQQQSKADSTYSKDEVVSEGRMYGTLNRSYESFGPVRIKVQHTKPIMDEMRGARSRNIAAVFVENDQGERFRLPFNNLTGARAMARHVSAGGVPTDELGCRITEMVSEMLTLRPFVRGMHSRTFENVMTTEMVESAFDYHSLLKNTLKKMKGKRGYTEYKDNYKPALVEDDFNAEELKELFVRKTLDERIEQALPLVHKAYNMMKETKNKFAQQFESWADTVAEGTWALPEGDDEVSQLIDLLSEPLPVGVDAQNATNALYNIIGDDGLFDQLGALAEEDPEADARDAVVAWIYDNNPSLYQSIMNEIGDEDSAELGGELDEGNFNADGSYNTSDDEQVVNDEDDYNYNEDQVESIQTAIIRRITHNIGQHQELLMKAGPDGVMNAARDVASFHAPVEELGSSDISIMVREVYREVGVEYPELEEAVGDDVVNKDEKLKRMGARELGVVDTMKTFPQWAKSIGKQIAGDKDASEDDLVLYNKSKATNEEYEDMPLDPPGYAKRVAELEAEGMTTSDAQGVADYEYESKKGPWAEKADTVSEMRRLAGLK